jgi:hypothetical protein
MRPSGEPTRLHAIAAGDAVLVVALGSQAGGAANAVHKVGAVTWHAAKFVGKDVVLEGYVLAKEPGYVLFSDEATGKITAHDLPVAGTGADTMQTKTKYVIEGIFLDHGLSASNGSPYHLELTDLPAAAEP